MNETGQGQARSLYESAPLPTAESVIVYSSPMRRAVETGTIATGRSSDSFLMDDRLKERSFGSWEGHYLSEIRGRTKELGLNSIWQLQCDGVESAGETQDRIKSFVDDMVKAIDADTKDIIIFAHGALIHQFLIHLKSRNALIPPEVIHRGFTTV